MMTETGVPLSGLVDYRARLGSTEAEVVSGRAQITRPGDLVHLSGIGWRVLDISDQSGQRQAWLLSDRVIGLGPYHKDKYVDITWERCDLRRWLNGEFLESLGEPLRRRIVQSQVSNEPNPVWEVGGGEATRDSVFLLSMQEAVQYLAGEAVDWQSQKRGFADANLVAVGEAGQPAWWWLRSPGLDLGGAAFVSTAGVVRGTGLYVSASGGARPAFWLNL